VSLQGGIAELAAQETRGIQEPLAKARAIYNYVIATMHYDKSGWGNGDGIWACTAKRGNCTDFSLAVYRHDAGSRNSCPLRNWFSVTR
jgi:transglutaminase-like putative cysteine protease